MYLLNFLCLKWYDILIKFYVIYLGGLYFYLIDLLKCYGLFI